MFKSHSTFSRGDSNTICDVTGEKVKMSQTRKRWDGYRVVAKAWHPRHPQDTPVIPTKEKAVKDVRTEDLTTEDAATFIII